MMQLTIYFTDGTELVVEGAMLKDVANKIAAWETSQTGHFVFESEQGFWGFNMNNVNRWKMIDLT